MIDQPCYNAVLLTHDGSALSFYKEKPNSSHFALGILQWSSSTVRRFIGGLNAKFLLQVRDRDQLDHVVVELRA